MKITYTERKCSKCKGTGEHWNGYCYPCDGTGIVRRMTKESAAAVEAQNEAHRVLEARMSEVRSIAKSHLSAQGISRTGMRDTLRSITILGQAG